MEMTETKLCPIMSVRGEDTSCVESECALWLSGPRKCSLIFIGYKAMVDLQQLQKKGAGT